jgi:hypothetical protein
MPVLFVQQDALSKRVIAIAKASVTKHARQNTNQQGDAPNPKLHPTHPTPATPVNPDPTRPAECEAAHLRKNTTVRERVAQRDAPVQLGKVLAPQRSEQSGRGSTHAMT